MTPKFVISHLDKQLGPFTEQELMAKWSKGEFLPIDYVYDEMKKDWILLAERFSWASGRGDGSPPPLKPNMEKKKFPPAAPTAQVNTPAPATSQMTQQKPMEKTIVIHAPALNIPAASMNSHSDADPLPTLTAIPLMNAPVEKTVSAAPAQPAPAPQATRSPGQPARVKIVNGVGEVDLNSDTPGQVEVLLQETTGTNLKLQEPLKVQVRMLEPEEIVWHFPIQHTVGSELEIHVKAVDAKGTLCNHFNQDFTLRIAASEPRLLTVKMTAGAAVVKLANTKAEKWHFNLEYVGERDLRLPAEKVVEWMPGPAARLILDGPPDLVAGNPLKVQVRAVDQFGNLAKTFTGTVVLEVKAS